MKQSSVRMKQEENMLDVREMRCSNNYCAMISFDGVTFQKCMHKKTCDVKYYFEILVSDVNI